MAKEKGKTLNLYAPESLRDCLDIPYKPIQLVSKIFLTGHEYSVLDVADRINMSRTNTRTQIDFLLKHRLIYLCRWDRTKSYSGTAMFKSGNLPSVENPFSKRAPKPAKPAPPPKPVVVDPQITYFNELSRAIVPVRSSDEMYQANWTYWNHIARRAA